MSRALTATNVPTRKITKTDVPGPQNEDVAGMSRAHPATDVPGPQNGDIPGMSSGRAVMDVPHRDMSR
jgi:hypothetical protein